MRRYRELSGKTFLVGIGAAKCGTSWLHAYLGGLEEVAASPIKELHFFNAKFARNAMLRPDETAMKRLAFHIVQQGDVCGRLRDNPLFQASVDRAAMIYDDDAYFAHFARLCGPRTRLFCDVTPGYALIGREGFAFLRSFCASQDVALKILYVMRDPVERLWSHVRYLNHLDSRREVARTWRDLIDDPAFMARSAYRETVEALDAVFAPDELVYAFYEDLFTQDGISDLCASVGLPAAPADFSVRHNETSVKVDLPQAARAAFATALAGEYAFCRSRFGHRVPAAWAS